jgi:ribosome biogenesis GTPase
VILNKADLCDDIDARRSDVESVALGVDIIVASAKNSDGLEPLIDHLSSGKTGVLLGSSGVGKSTLINSLLGEKRMLTHENREDDSRGRHTTTHRELVLLPSGGILIDTPGLRELQLWVEEDSLRLAFDDIEALAPQCRFRDCQHELEPGCAVKAAVDTGDLDEQRLISYHKLKREMKRLEARQSGLDRHLEHVRGRKFASLIKEVKKLKQRYQ